MPDRVYIESTIVGYLTMRPSKQVVVAARQEITKQWWAARQFDFRLVTSQVVLDEISSGDHVAATERLDAIQHLPLLDLTHSSEDLASRLVAAGPLPTKALADAAHIAVAAVHSVEFVLTWNCTHIANAALRPRIEQIIRESGFRPPILCTPEELLDD